MGIRSSRRVDGDMPHSVMYTVGTGPFIDATVAIRDNLQEAEDEAERMNDCMGPKHNVRPYGVFKALVHFPKQ